MQGKRIVVKSESGQSIVEFAVSATFILMLLVGVADFGRALFTYIALRDAAQEGAVYGSICPNNMSAIESHARQASNYPINLSDTTAVSVACAYEDGSESVCGSYVPSPGVGIKVTVSYPHFQITTPLLGAIMGSQSMSLSADATDTILRNETCN
jgi:Flp pilus assembly protein TadG